MKKLLVAFLTFTAAFTADAKEIKFLDNPDWNSVLEKAREENKLIFFSAYTTWCGYCKQMDSEVYTEDQVADFYNENFINVKYNMEAGEGLKLAFQYNVTSFPTSLFMDDNGKILHKSMGYVKASDFLDVGKTALNPQERLSGLKEKALSMNPQEFLAFGQSSIQNGDREYEMIAREYLQKQTDILSNKALLDIIMQTLDVIPTETMLIDLVNNKEKVAEVGGYDLNELDIRLVGLSVAFARQKFMDPGTGEQDLKGIKDFLFKVIPTKAFFTSNYYAIEYYLRQSDQENAYKEYSQFLKDAWTKASFNELCNMVIQFGAAFNEAEQLQNSFDAVENYPIKEVKNTDAFQKNLIRVLVYLKLEDEANFKLYADKILKDPHAPEALKKQMEQTMAQIDSQNGQ